jgi:D-glycero-alpha-D-manno-heptose-7-phosphate kinase
MIICRSPLRISLGGGGTDLESYYSKKGGYLVAGAINKYVYTVIHEAFQKEIILKYSKLERTKNIEKIKHPIIKAALELYMPNVKNIEITSFADIPSGTGLGSSSSFTTALISGLSYINLERLNCDELAEEACKIEIDILKEPIGKQDQYIASWGGIREFTFKKNGSVGNKLIYSNIDDYADLRDNLLMVYTGKTRKASSILSAQKIKSTRSNSSMIKNLDQVKKMGKMFASYLKNKDFVSYGKLMNEHWEIKKERSSSMSNRDIDDIYDYGIKNGSNGGKVIGAGGGGFILFQTDNPKNLKKEFLKKNIKSVNFDFVSSGTEIIAI